MHGSFCNKKEYNESHLKYRNTANKNISAYKHTFYIWKINRIKC